MASSSFTPVNSALYHTRRVKTNILGNNVPSYEKKSIEDFVRFLHKVNLNPQYQRAPVWSQETSNGLITSMFNNSSPIPGFLLYKLHPGDEGYDSKFRFEMPDGQNRSRAIKSFVEGEKIEIPGKKPYYTYLPYKNPDGTFQYVFFSEEQNAGREWEELNPGIKAQYFTEEERDDFLEYCIEIRTITTPLTYNDRAAMFLSLQNGKPVRNSDLDKNLLDCGLISYFRENNFENLIKTEFLKYCTRKITKYWTRWGARLVLMFLSVRKVKNVYIEEPEDKYTDSDDEEDEKEEEEEDDEEEEEKNDPKLALPPLNELALQKFLFGDSKIYKMFKDCSPSLELTSEEKVAFQQAFTKIADFLKKSMVFTENNDFKLNPTQLYALFYHLTFNTYSEEALLSHMKFWETDGRRMVNKRIWESSGKETRVNYFKDCLAQLAEYNKEAVEPIRKEITPKLKKEVWKNCFGTAKLAKCGCGETITLKVSHCGHITAHARGGTTTVDNLRPICVKCNLQIVTRNIN